MNDDDLEAMVRRSLQHHADDVEDPGGRARAAYAGVRRRRRIQGAVAGVAAVLVLVPVAVIAAANQPGPAHPVATPPLAGGWRVESYRGVQLEVPASWGWGATGGVSPEGLIGCGLTEYSAATSYVDIRPLRQGVALAPYVGRPMPTSRCAQRTVPSSALVWFDSPLPVGTSPATGVTVSVLGTKRFNITVRDSNSLQRRAILGSIYQVAVDANGCTERPVGMPANQSPPASGSVTSISVCVYYADVDARWPGRLTDYLYYSTRVSAGAPAAARAILAAGPGRGFEPDNLCLGRSPAKVDLVEHVDDRSYAWGIEPNACMGQSVGYNDGSAFHELTSNSVRRWAIDAVALYAAGTPDPNRLAPFLPVSY